MLVATASPARTALKNSQLTCGDSPLYVRRCTISWESMSSLQIVVRWVHFSVSILLAALFLFELVVVAPFARKPPETTESLFLSLRQLNRRLVWWTWSIAQISWVAWLWLITAWMSGEDLIACINSDALSTVLFSTQFGHLWLIRLFIGVVFGTILPGETKIQGPKRFGCEPRLAFLHRTCLAGMGRSCCRRCQTLRDTPSSRRYAPPADLGILAGRFAAPGYVLSAARENAPD